MNAGTDTETEQEANYEYVTPTCSFITQSTLALIHLCSDIRAAGLICCVDLLQAPVASPIVVADVTRIWEGILSPMASFGDGHPISLPSETLLLPNGPVEPGWAQLRY